MIKEACVENLEEAIYAEAHGATQIELCSNLSLDGLSPSLTLFEKIKSQVSIPIKVMIRSRAGSFYYNTEEIEFMSTQIKQFASLNPDGFVIGALDKYQAIDIPTITHWCSLAPSYSFCLHKCIDDVTDPIKCISSLKKIINLKYILSSGGPNTAWEGRKVLNEMIQEAKPEITVIAAGKITHENLELHQKNIFTEAFHGRKIV